MTRHRPRPVGLGIWLVTAAVLALWGVGVVSTGHLVPPQEGHADLVAASASVGC